MTTTSWPDIHLEAVNKTAAFLLHRTGADPAPVQEYVTSIRADMDKVDRAIASISGQLQTRFDPDWAPGARRALKGYYTQRNTLKKMLATASEALLVIRTRIKENEKTARMRELEIGAEQQRITRAEERMKRIAESTNLQVNTFMHFKRMVRDVIGEEKCIELLRLAQQEASK